MGRALRGSGNFRRKGRGLGGQTETGSGERQPAQPRGWAGAPGPAGRGCGRRRRASASRCPGSRTRFPRPAPPRWPGDVVAAATPPLLGVPVPTPGPRAGRRSWMASSRRRAQPPPLPPRTGGQRLPAHLLGGSEGPHACPSRPAASWATAASPQHGERHGHLPAAGRRHQPLQHPVQRQIGHRAPHPQPTSGCLTHAR